MRVTIQMLQIIKLQYSAQLASNMSSFSAKALWQLGWLYTIAADSKRLHRSPLLLQRQHSFPAEPNSSCESFKNAQLRNPSEGPAGWSWMSSSCGSHALTTLCLRVPNFIPPPPKVLLEQGAGNLPWTSERQVQAGRNGPHQGTVVCETATVARCAGSSACQSHCVLD